jgi:hypothetical protein
MEDFVRQYYGYLDLRQMLAELALGGDSRGGGVILCIVVKNWLRISICTIKIQ